MLKKSFTLITRTKLVVNSYAEYSDHETYFFQNYYEFTQVSADLDKVGDYWPPVAAAVWLI